MNADLVNLLGNYGGAGAKSQPPANVPSTSSSTPSRFAGLLDTMARAGSVAGGAGAAGRTAAPLKTTDGDASETGRPNDRSPSYPFALWPTAGDGSAPSTDDTEDTDDASADASPTDPAVSSSAGVADIGALAQAVLLAAPPVPPQAAAAAPLPDRAAPQMSGATPTSRAAATLSCGGTTSPASGGPASVTPIAAAPPSAWAALPTSGRAATVTATGSPPAAPSNGVPTAVAAAAFAPAASANVDSAPATAANALRPAWIAPPANAGPAPVAVAATAPSDGAAPVIDGTPSDPPLSAAPSPSGAAADTAVGPFDGSAARQSEESPATPVPSIAPSLPSATSGASVPVEASVISAAPTDAPVADASAGPVLPGGAAATPVPLVTGETAPAATPLAAAPPVTAAVGTTVAASAGASRPAARITAPLPTPSLTRQPKAPAVPSPPMSLDVASEPLTGATAHPADTEDDAMADDAAPTPEAVPSASPGAEAVMAVTRAEFAAQQGAATQQVASALSSLVNAAQTTAPGDAQTAASPPATTSDTAKVPGTIRTTADGGREIIVKLDPEHLGSVSIRLKLTGGKVDVSITVSDSRTLDVLNRDRHMLSAAVSSAGMADGTLSLTPEVPDAVAPQSSPAAAFGMAGRSPDESASASSDPSGERRRDGREPSETSPDGEPDEKTSTPEAKRTGDLYV